jgi:hypothetical protein
LEGWRFIEPIVFGGLDEPCERYKKKQMASGTVQGARKPCFANENDRPAPLGMINKTKYWVWDHNPALYIFYIFRV